MLTELIYSNIYYLLLKNKEGEKIQTHEKKFKSLERITARNQEVLVKLENAKYLGEWI